MCGILGLVNFKGQVHNQRFDSALSLLRHRGPDNRTSKRVDEEVILGHARLSIIDLSETNNQPFSIDNRYSIVYNGEVYNYIELRDELKAAGIEFRTSGDTEVVLQSYKIWGENCVTRFNGMWAFAIYDSLEKKLFCSRDRFGVKPFNYYYSEEEFIFSSDIKPIIYYRPELKKPNLNVIANFVSKSLGAQSEETWFHNVYRLFPGHNLVVTKAKLNIYRYWEYPQKINRKISFNDAKLEFNRIFKDAVKIRMRSDVPVGSTLSSGLDSSSIVGVLKNLNLGTIDTFTAFSRNENFTDNDKMVFKTNVELDESIVAKKMAGDFNVKSNLIEVSFKNYTNQLAEAIYFMESGHSSPATVCIHQLYKDARKKVKVLLEGQGADELLGGYVVDNFPNYIIQRLKNGEIIRVAKELKSFLKIYSFKHLVLLFFRRLDSPLLSRLRTGLARLDVFDRTAFQYKYLKDNRKDNVHFDELFNQSLYKQHSSGLVNLLHYGDALSMAQSIESRLPFMDYRLVEFAFTLPFDFKLNFLQGKFIQRKALEEYLPDYVSKSLIKIGFATPIDKLIKESPEIEEILLNKSCGNLFNEAKVKDVYQRHRQGKGNHSSLLFRILSAKIWYQIFFEGAFNPPEEAGSSLRNSALI